MRDLSGQLGRYVPCPLTRAQALHMTSASALAFGPILVAVQAQHAGASKDLLALLRGRQSTAASSSAGAHDLMPRQGTRAQRMPSCG